MGEYAIYSGLFFVSLCGMFIHFLKKNVKGETATEIRSYFHDNFKSTLTALFFTAMSFVGAIAADAINADRVIASTLTAGLIGYTFDSLINKWDKNGSV